MPDRPVTSYVANKSPSPQKQQHLAALEALFTPKQAAALPRAPAHPSKAAKIVTTTRAPVDPVSARLVADLLAAEGAEPVRRAVVALERAGHDVPREQAVQLRMLQHPDERRVRSAIDALAAIFDREPPQRRTIVEGRLRRLEDLADDVETRDAATALRKRMHRAEA